MVVGWSHYRESAAKARRGVYGLSTLDIVFVSLCAGTLFCLPPVFHEKYIDSPAAFAAIVSLCAALAMAIRHRGRVVLSVPSVWLFVASVALCLASVLSAADTNIYYMLFCIGSMLFVNDNGRGGDVTEGLCRLVSLLAIVECALAWRQLISRCDPALRYTAMTGTFENTIGLVSFLLIALPFCLHMAFGRMGWRRQLLPAVSASLTVATILFSGSRIGMIAAAVIVFYHLYKVGQLPLQFLRRWRWLLAAVAVISLAVLYVWKKDSADGRILIWRISWEMVKEKPVFGHGINGFQSGYMERQADFFSHADNDRYQYLAGDVYEPFNEYLKVLVEFGVAGSALVICGIALLLYGSRGDKSSRAVISREILFAVLFCAMFSYPLKFPVVWVALGYAAANLSSGRRFVMRLRLWVVLPMFILLLAGLSYRTILKYEWRRTIADFEKGENAMGLASRYEGLTALDRSNPFYLYTYAAWLYGEGRFGESLAILDDVRQNLSNYPVTLLTGHNYWQRGDYAATINCYRRASHMSPPRFMPLYLLMMVCREAGDMTGARSAASEIVGKQAKVNSPEVDRIRRAVMDLLGEVDDYGVSTIHDTH